jgi:hypothetical protein
VKPRRLHGPPARSGDDAGTAIFVLGLSAGLLAALVIDRGVRFFLDRDIELVRAVRNLALQDFVHDVDRNELVDDALGGMLGGLDRYSHYYAPQEIAALERGRAASSRSAYSRRRAGRSSSLPRLVGRQTGCGSATASRAPTARRSA